MSESTPVEGFGKRLIEKLGWFEGRGLGKKPKGEVPIRFNSTPRGERLGVGAEQLQQQTSQGLAEGSFLKVTEGKHKGIKGTLTGILPNAFLIQIQSGTLKVPKHSVEPCSNLESVSKSFVKKKLKWVQPGLRVRVRSKSAEEGTLYNTKVLVHDVIDDYTFTVFFKGKPIESLSERDLETVIPKAGETVMVLKERRLAKLLERNRRKDEVLVQFLEPDFELLKLRQDDVCEYTSVK